MWSSPSRLQKCFAIIPPAHPCHMKHYRLPFANICEMPLLVPKYKHWNTTTKFPSRKSCLILPPRTFVGGDYDHSTCMHAITVSIDNENLRTRPPDVHESYHVNHCNHTEARDQACDWICSTWNLSCLILSPAHLLAVTVILIHACTVWSCPHARLLAVTMIIVRACTQLLWA